MTSNTKSLGGLDYLIKFWMEWCGCFANAKLMCGFARLMLKQNKTKVAETSLRIAGSYYVDAVKMLMERKP